MMHESNFSRAVEAMVLAIPPGRVMTYGQVASLIGHPRAARQVGGVAHFGSPDVPWHRLVNRFGGLASGYHGGRLAQKRHLEEEGVLCGETKHGLVVDLNQYLWWPEEAVSAGP